MKSREGIGAGKVALFSSRPFTPMLQTKLSPAQVTRNLVLISPTSDLFIAPYKPLLRKCKEHMMTALKLKSHRKEVSKQRVHEGMFKSQVKFLDKLQGRRNTNDWKESMVT